jgi:hypothetical protein
MGTVTTPNANVKRKPKLTLGRWANLAITALVVFLGPVLIVVGTLHIDADEELARSGERTVGTIVDFDDVRKASARNIRVEYQALDGLVHHTSASVDHDQHPVVGEEVTVVYSESDPDQATVVGYESGGEFLRGAGVILTLIFGGIAVFAFLSRLLGLRKKSGRTKRSKP